MPRRKKIRFCRKYSGQKIYKPLAAPMPELEVHELEHDELEAMRLCDLEGLTQHEAGLRIGVSRGTVQRLLGSGRTKLLRFILEGAALRVVPVSNLPPDRARPRSKQGPRP